MSRSAAFSLEILPQLRRSCDVEVFVDSPEGPQTREADSGVENLPVHNYLRAYQRHRELPFDAFVYNLEDHPRALFVRRALALQPGVVIAHDLELSTLGRQRAIEEEERRLIRARQSLLLGERESDGDEGDDESHDSWERHAAGILCLNEHGAAILEGRGFTRPLGLIGFPISRPEPRPVVDERSPFVVGFAGGSRFEGRAEAALRAFERFLAFDSEAELRFRWILPSEHVVKDSQKLAEVVLAPETLSRVDFVVAPTYSELRDELALCRVFLGIHFSLFASLPLAVITALGLGLPVLLSDFGPSSEVPAQVSPRIPLGAGEEEMTAKVLALLRRDERVRKALCNAAAEYVDVVGRPEGAASDLLSFLAIAQMRMEPFRVERAEKLIAAEKRLRNTVPRELFVDFWASESRAAGVR